MKIGLYSVTYRGVWYEGDGINVFDLMPLASKQGWEGIELDTERPHAAPMDLSSDDRKRLRDLSGTLDLPICAVSPNCDLSSPVASHREAMICYVGNASNWPTTLGPPSAKSSRRGGASPFMMASPPTTRPTRANPFPTGKATGGTSWSMASVSFPRWTIGAN